MAFHYEGDVIKKYKESFEGEATLRGQLEMSEEMINIHLKKINKLLVENDCQELPFEILNHILFLQKLREQKLEEKGTFFDWTTVLESYKNETLVSTDMMKRIEEIINSNKNAKKLPETVKKQLNDSVTYLKQEFDGIENHIKFIEQKQSERKTDLLNW